MAAVPVVVRGKELGIADLELRKGEVITATMDIHNKVYVMTNQRTFFAKKKSSMRRAVDRVVGFFKRSKTNGKEAN